MNNDKTFIKFKNISSLSLSLNYCCSTYNHPIEKADINDPILKLINNYKDIVNIQNNTENANITKFFYFNKRKIHSILYDKNEVIDLKYNENNKNVAFYFYLTLLIRENPNVLNYNYDEEYITKLNEENINNKNDKNQLNKIIKAKFIIELTQEYKLDNDYFDNEEGRALDEIIEMNNNIINNNKNIFEDLNIDLDLKKIIFFPIDELYNKIIIGLIKSKKFNNFNYINDIILQLNLEQIDITENMYNTLENFLDNKENELITNNYEIKDEKDLNDNLKINFGYFLIKYIYKNDFLKNNSKFITSLRESIKNILNRNKNSLKNIENSKYQKFRYIINDLCLKKKKFIKNNLETYYNEFIDQKRNEKNKNNKDQDKSDNHKIDHDELYIVELINQIFNVDEFRDEYNNILEKEDKDPGKEDEELKLFSEKLNIIKKYEIYKDRLIIILKNKKFKEKFQKNKTLNESILKELFNFYNCEEEGKMSKLENKLVLGDPVGVDGSVIKSCDEWF